jgi:rare lipoprotein A
MEDTSAVMSLSLTDASRATCSPQPRTWPSRLVPWISVALILSMGACAAPRQGEQIRHTEIGIASHYAERFAGRKTASGQIYRPNMLTAAHRTLPMGTRLRVTRIDKMGHVIAGPVIVVVNDRGPYAHGRIIDLSSEAARRLGLYGTIGRVRIEVLDPPPAPPVAGKPLDKQ